MRTPAQAIAYAASGPIYKPGSCLAFVVAAYQLSNQTPAWDAKGAYAMVNHAGKGSPPLGVPLWWLGGQRNHGHVCLSDGNGGAYSTDFSDSGYVGDGRVRHLSDYRNIDLKDQLLTYKGWSYDLESVLVVPIPKEPKMILVRKSPNTAVYKYEANHLETLTDHQAKRAIGFGAVVQIVPSTDDIWTLPVK